MPSKAVNFKHGVASFGVPIIGGSGNVPVMGNVWFVDGTLGSNSFHGKSKSRAFATIQKACDSVESGDTIFVLPKKGSTDLDFTSGYNENVTTPSYASGAGAAHVNLIGVSPTGNGVLWSDATATSPLLTMRSPFWRVSGFRFEPGANGGCIYIHRVANTGIFANYCRIDHNYFAGNGVVAYGLDIVGCPFSCQLVGNIFELLGAPAVKCTAGDVALAYRWVITDNIFQDNAHHIDMNPRGFNSALISRNYFNANPNASGAFQADQKLRLTGGRNNIIFDNTFGDDGGTYNSAGGYVAGSNDSWVGNYFPADAANVYKGQTFGDPA